MAAILGGLPRLRRVPPAYDFVWGTRAATSPSRLISPWREHRLSPKDRTGSAPMKMMWFHLMPYTELPDDFREKHPSVWVDIHSSLFDPRRAHLMYNDFMDELEFAAECGFDAICVNEHHSNGYGLMPSPNLIATALARRTTDTALSRR